MSLPRSNDMVSARQRLRRLLSLVDDPELKAQIERELERIAVIDKRDSQFDEVRGDPTIRADQPTANGRIYSRALLEREFQRFREQVINSRRAFGTLGIPGDGRTRLRDVSHRITDLQLDEDGTAQATVEILPTERGRALRDLLQADVPLSMSVRGYGSVDRDGVVGDDYQLISCDVAADGETRARRLDIIPFTATAHEEDNDDE